MLRWTVRRAAALVPKERVVCIVAQGHQSWWQSQLSDLPAGNIVVQPRNKGTAVGILLPLLTVLQRDPSAAVLVLPSDHSVENEELLLEVLRNASRLAQADSQRVVLVGVDATQDATDYGWIVPGIAAAYPMVRGVSKFCEKPDLFTTQRLRRRGALVNSLIMAASGRALLNLFSEAVPGLVEQVAFHKQGRAGSPAEIQRIYDGLSFHDFSREVLERSTEHLLVYPAPTACGWSDLGTPRRMSRFLDRHQAAAA
jgi:mannose-1-phosphate guanylyltransferase